VITGRLSCGGGKHVSWVSLREKNRVSEGGHRGVGRGVRVSSWKGEAFQGPLTQMISRFLRYRKKEGGAADNSPQNYRKKGGGKGKKVRGAAERDPQILSSGKSGKGHTFLKRDCKVNFQNPEKPGNEGGPEKKRSSSEGGKRIINPKRGRKKNIGKRMAERTGRNVLMGGVSKRDMKWFQSSERKKGRRRENCHKRAVQRRKGKANLGEPQRGEKGRDVLHSKERKKLKNDEEKKVPISLKGSGELVNLRRETQELSKEIINRRN